MNGTFPMVLRHATGGWRRWVVLAALLFLAWPAHAQNTTAEFTLPPGKTLKVAIVHNDPFVMDNQGLLTGFSMELWQEIAERNKWPAEYVAKPTIQAGLDAVRTGECDVLVSDTSITSDRIASGLDFSEPLFRSGFQIMVTDARPHTVKWMVESILKILQAPVLLITAAVVLVVSVLVHLFERKHNPTFPKAVHEGFAEAFYLVVSLALTGKSNYKGFPGPMGRYMTVFWMVAGMLMVAFVTSTITTTMTVERLQGRITGPQDLPGKAIGVLTGTTGEIYALDHQLNYSSYPDIKAAAADLVAGKIQAIVADAPILQYYDNSHPELPITEVGPIFEPRDYGFAVRRGDALLHPLDESLTFLKERGELKVLGSRYFGSVYRE